MLKYLEHEINAVTVSDTAACIAIRFRLLSLSCIPYSRLATSVVGKVQVFT